MALVRLGGWSAVAEVSVTGPLVSLNAMADATTTADTAVFTVTPEAIARILELREAEDDPPGLALRVEVTGTSGVEYAYDLTFDPMAEADEADAQFLQGDLPVIVPDRLDRAAHRRHPRHPQRRRPGPRAAQPEPPQPARRASTSSSPARSPSRCSSSSTEQINPALAAHGGFAELKGVEDTVVYVTMGGGCQGCAVSAP